MKRTSTLAVLLLLAGGSANAQVNNEELICRADDPRMDKYGYLRSLSLDLLGRAPTVEEYAALDAVDDVTDEMIDAMLDTEAFVDRTVRRHRAFLWNNVENVNLLNYQTSFARTGSGLFWRRRPAIEYRGDDVPCNDVPAQFGPNGEILYDTDPQGIRREGFVMVTPYWDPSTPIKVCAFDAQTNEISPSGQDCRLSAGLRDTGCGCGENLQLCRYGNTNYRAANRAFAEDVERRIGAVIRNDEPYTALFTSRRAFANGPLVHFMKHQTGVPAGVSLRPHAIDVERLPNLQYAADYGNWVEYQLGEDHAGILTSPAYLLRFQTNRARANRFYEAFLCQPFSPPAGGLPAVDPDAIPNPDLQRRDGCKYCHALLEPAAAHWGRWTERGAGFLSEEAFPAMREDCQRCGEAGQLCSRECRLFYVTTTYSSAEDPYIGMLSSYAFLREDHQVNVEGGPKFLIASTIVDDRFPRCTARRALEGMFGRELSDEENDALGEASRAFVASSYDYKALVKSIVKSDVYRRVR